VHHCVSPECSVRGVSLRPLPSIAIMHHPSARGVLLRPLPLLLCITAELLRLPVRQCRARRLRGTPRYDGHD